MRIILVNFYVFYFDVVICYVYKSMIVCQIVKVPKFVPHT